MGAKEYGAFAIALGAFVGHTNRKMNALIARARPMRCATVRRSVLRQSATLALICSVASVAENFFVFLRDRSFINVSNVFFLTFRYPVREILRRFAHLLRDEFFFEHTG